MKLRLFGLFICILLVPFTSYCYAIDMCYEYQEIKEYDKAIEECSKHISEDGWNKAITYNNRANAYKAKGDLERAISDYNKAIELNPEYANAFNNRGNTYYALGNIEHAIADFNKAIAFDPKLDVAYNNRGLAYQIKRNFDKAVSDYDIALALNPDDEYVYIDQIIASKNISHDKYKKALKRLKKHIRWNNSNEWIRTISRYYLELDGLDEKTVLEEARNCKDTKEIKERLCEAYYYLAEKRFMEGNRKGAEEFFRKSVETNVYSFIEYQNSKTILRMMSEGTI
jgi:lipoprotein NlpI